MESEGHHDDIYRVEFGIFEADLKARELRRSGIRVRLQAQPFSVLAILLETPGEVVSRETLQQRLWGADTTVDFDHSLGIAVNKLRDALGDSADNPRFIETLARRGYRFIAPVKTLSSTEIPPPALPPSAEVQEAAVSATIPGAESGQAVPEARAQKWAWISGFVACLCVILLLALLFRAPIRRPYRVAQVTHSGQVMANEMDVESFSSSASDGTRIYFSEIDNGNPALAVALASNGEVSEFRLPSELGAPLIGSLSPDGSALIVRSHLQAEPEQPLWIVPTLGGTARRVPNVLAHDATWMPDGQRLLIASGTTLKIVGLDGGNPQRLLETPGLAFWLRWSPDGRRLRFTLRDPKLQTDALWEAAADGSNPHPLLPNWSRPAAECCGSWTSDGKEYVFQSLHNGHSNIWGLREKPWFAHSRSPYQITAGPLDYEAPTTVPGTHRVDFIGMNWQIELLRAQSKSGFVPLGKSLGRAALAEYSPDGEWVAWLNVSDGSLWRSRADGAERIELTTPPLRIFSMKWAPDSKHLALMAEEPGKPWRIYLIAAEGGEPVPLLNEERNEADPNWSADGKLLVFGRLPDRMDSVQPKSVYLLDPQTHQATEVPGSRELFSPRISPDGRYIAAIRLNQRELLLFDRSTERWTTISTHGVGDPVWSRDSRSLYFQDFLEAGKPIYRIAIPSGQPEQVATLGSLRPIAATDYRLIGLAPDGQLIVSARTSTVNLYEVNLDE